MDWFETLVGFPEGDHTEVQRRLAVRGDQLHSLVNGRQYAIGKLELLSLEALADRAAVGGGLPGRLRVTCLEGDVRALHHAPAFVGGLFQVASQFNLLEMVGPEVTPEHGVTRYAHDGTQGPACAMAAGAATIYRNYLVPVGDTLGQRRTAQLDGLHALGDALALALGTSQDTLWTMRNGYAMCTERGLKQIRDHLRYLPDQEIDALRARLQVGVHWDVEVTDTTTTPGQIVSQVFCSALPVAYGGIAAPHWEAFASLVLEAAYEATLWAAVCNAQRGGSATVLLTRLGGGAFRNDDQWIDTALRRALLKFCDTALDVRLVNRGAPTPAQLAMVRAFPGETPMTTAEPAADGQAEVILEVGTEGGSITLHGVRTASGWRYFREADDQTPQLVGDPSLQHRSAPCETWWEALALLNRYPWEHLYAVAVHPEFRELVREALLLRTRGEEPRWSRNWHALGIFGPADEDSADHA